VASTREERLMMIETLGKNDGATRGRLRRPKQKVRTVARDSRKGYHMGSMGRGRGERPYLCGNYMTRTSELDRKARVRCNRDTDR